MTKKKKPCTMSRKRRLSFPALTCSLLFIFLQCLAPGALWAQSAGEKDDKPGRVVPISSWLSIEDVLLTKKTLPPGWTALDEVVFSPWNGPLQSTLKILAKTTGLEVQGEKLQPIQPGEGAPFNIHFYHTKGLEFSRLEAFLKGFLKPREWTHVRLGDIFVIFGSRSASHRFRGELALEEQFFLTVESILADPAGRPEVHSILGMKEMAARKALHMGECFLNNQEWDKAAIYLKKATTLLGQDASRAEKWRANLSLGRASRKNGSLKVSESALQQAARLAERLSESKQFTSRIQLAATLACLERTDKAIGILRSALTPGDRRVPKSSLNELRKICEEEEVLRKMIRKDPYLSVYIE